MARTRELRRRIKSTQSTRQITKTMEMVATSKLKRAQDRVVAARPYAAALTQVITDLYSPDLAERFPLLRRPKGVPKTVALIVITSNRGLCGAFNSNLIREGRRRIQELEAQGSQVELHLVGRKGIGFFRYVGRPIASQRTDLGDRPSAKQAAELVTPLMERFGSGALDGVEVVFAKFNSALSTPPTLLTVLPVEPPTADGRVGGSADRQAGVPRTAEPTDRRTAETRYTPWYILRPSAEEIIDAILPLYVRNAVYRALVETAASEQGARRTAMKNATDSAGDIIDLLRRTYNRARQAQITQELAEIVGGAESLKG
jgi:F-type H+-transporting ATPase subunit gamma